MGKIKLTKHSDIKKYTLKVIKTGDKESIAKALNRYWKLFRNKNIVEDVFGDIIEKGGV